MNIQRFSPAQQGTGAFDGGKIIEQKPIGFPGEGGAVKRVGPLFYWAWAFTPKDGYIPPHPHQAFEIVTYVIQGKAVHGDSLGTKSTIGAGGAQVMQTGSGVSHEERFVGPDMEGFQIWFEPDLRQTRYDQPTYRQFEHEQFPIQEHEGVTVKEVIGGQSPVALKVDAHMRDITIQAGGEYVLELAAGRSMAVLAILGTGSLGSADDEPSELHSKDFAVLDAGGTSGSAIVRAAAGEALRLVAIDVPSETDYPLYNKR
ncbi:pirin family protein [Paenibacillus oceani]|uniref:Pirin family protein n=1 Tax=Paenibacillus oceani TaxID=2772510 RepID=A0A927H009_9BACL|nr:pirin family protein [Paenibacillus oceani]MBD2863210.1 pirin family protein [Paenibacillus oceani]